MKWPWRRRTQQPVPLPEPEPAKPQNPESGGFTIQDHELERYAAATANVMATRDGINVFLSIIWDHRQDGHECLPYCVPARMTYFLDRMDGVETRIMLTVVLKDMVESYLRQEAAEGS